MDTDSALFTDQYELVMAHGYWQLGMAEQTACFQLNYRSNPFNATYTISCGLQDVIRYLKNFQFSDSDLNYLAEQALFNPEFLAYLKQLTFSCDIDAMPEGQLVFEHEPMLRIQGPLIQCQLLETALINFMNFSTLNATKASLICQAASGDAVIEFGVRRAQGPNGGLTASRASYIGGCDGTSHVLAGKHYDIPIKGTQAHSWIMAFGNEKIAFEKFATIMGNETVLLVDTYDTINGVKCAIQVGQQLRARGQDLKGIRLDSGDFVKLSQDARKLLNDAGFHNTLIMASGDLDEHRISTLKAAGCQIDAWGVGTKLSTCYDQASLNTIYKLTAIASNTGDWDYRLKVSDQKEKSTMAGRIQVRRYTHQGRLIGDVLYDIDAGITDSLPKNADNAEDLLQPIFRQGKLVYQAPDIHTIRKLAIQHTQQIHQQDPPSITQDPGLAKIQEIALNISSN